jgi:hypothetical protein
VGFLYQVSGPGSACGERSPIRYLLSKGLSRKKKKLGPLPAVFLLLRHGYHSVGEPEIPEGDQSPSSRRGTNRQVLPPAALKDAFSPAAARQSISRQCINGAAEMPVARRGADWFGAAYLILCRIGTNPIFHRLPFRPESRLLKAAVFRGSPLTRSPTNQRMQIKRFSSVHLPLFHDHPRPGMLADFGLIEIAQRSCKGEFGRIYHHLIPSLAGVAPQQGKRR